MVNALQRLRSCLPALTLGLALVSAGTLAQEDQGEPLKQIKLTESQVRGFTSAQPDLSAIAPKLQEAGTQPDAALQARLEDIAKKHGFASFRELDNVAANISIVMAGLDTETGEFTEPVDALKKELADVKADASIAEDARKQLVDELGEAIKVTPPLQHKENVDLIKAHREEIERALD